MRGKNLGAHGVRTCLPPRVRTAQAPKPNGASGLRMAHVYKFAFDLTGGMVSGGGPKAVSCGPSKLQRRPTCTLRIHQSGADTSC